MVAMSTADVIVLGSGPAAVSAAWPLVESGLEVLMLEAGGSLKTDMPPADRPSRAELRSQPLSDQDPKTWETLLGDDLRVLRPTKHKFPKLRFLLGDDVGRFLASTQIAAHDFDVIGVFARGGLSNVWAPAPACSTKTNCLSCHFPRAN